MIEELPSEPAVGADSFDTVQDTALFPEEEQWAAPTATGRRARFTTIRDCARQGWSGSAYHPPPCCAARPASRSGRAGSSAA
ncbi:hypothetical protein [Kitasatospora sp. NPDC057015]|uniref:hypothetical protein n=1 Tax=Kitasatospora sp. NPDC057015 TaxID=3346001 RepID=UPI0036408655